MLQLRLLVGFLACALGAGVSVAQAIEGYWLGALAALLLGPIVGIAFAVGFSTASEMPMFLVTAAIVMLLGIASIFSGHRAFDVDLTKARGEALYAFAKMGGVHCEVRTPELSSLQMEGIKACALQDKVDQISAIFELQKATNFGPTLTLIDQVRAASQQKDADWCVEAIKATHRLCPSAFLLISHKSRVALGLQ